MVAQGPRQEAGGLGCRTYCVEKIADGLASRLDGLVPTYRDR
jgi:hypothetical protein